MKENNWLNNPDLYGPACALSAYGMNFQPELFLEETTFAEEQIIFKGKLGSPGRQRSETKNKVVQVDSSAINIFEQTLLVVTVSKSGVSAIQHKEATLFLKQYRDEILRLSRFQDVERVILRFSVGKGESREEHSREFMDLAFSCGITALM